MSAVEKAFCESLCFLSVITLDKMLLLFAGMYFCGGKSVLFIMWFTLLHLIKETSVNPGEQETQLWLSSSTKQVTERQMLKN